MSQRCKYTATRVLYLECSRPSPGILGSSYNLARRDINSTILTSHRYFYLIPPLRDYLKPLIIKTPSRKRLYGFGSEISKISPGNVSRGVGSRAPTNGPRHLKTKATLPVACQDGSSATDQHTNPSNPQLTSILPALIKLTIFFFLSGLLHCSTFVPWYDTADDFEKITSMC